MVGVLIVSHGGFAEVLISSLQFLVGKQLHAAYRPDVDAFLSSVGASSQAEPWHDPSVLFRVGRASRPPTAS